MVHEKAGLSPTERSILQDEGYTGIGQENGNFKMWKFRIKNKIRPTITDSLLILKHRKWIELEKYLLLYCKNDLIEIRDLINELLDSNLETTMTLRELAILEKPVSKF